MKIQIKKPDIRVINIKTFAYIAIYIMFLKPAIVEDIYYLDLFFNALRFGLSIIFFIKIMMRSLGKGKRLILYYSLCFLAVLISTFIHNGEIKRVLANFVPTIGLLCWIYLESNRLIRIVRVFYSTGLFMLVLNLIAIILFPDGIWKREIYTSVWLLGQKQDFYACMVGVAFCGLFVFVENHKKKRSLIFAFAVMICTVVVTKATGTLICIASIVILLWLETIKKKIVGIRILSLVNTAGVIATAVIAYTYKNMLRLQSFLKSLSSTGMSKDLTFFVRTQMWEHAINMFIKHPILGTGRMKEDIWYETSGLSFYHTISHNLYFDILMTGGGIAIGLFLAFEVIVFLKLKKSWNVQLSRYMGYCIFAINVLFLTECPYTPMVIMCFGLVYWLPDICYCKSS